MGLIQCRLRREDSLTETKYMSIDTIVFFTLAISSIISAILVITRRSPIMSVVYLVLNFLILAVIYLTLQAQFIAVIQVIVYAGAIMVLFLFVVMLLNLGKEEALTEKITYKKRVAVGLVVVMLVQIIVGIMMSDSKFTRHIAPNAEQIGTVEGIGKMLFTQYLFPFEVTSVLLLAAIIGAVVLAKKRIDG
ncbi:MAG: NADH-quinone oxidoreductase subunit J [Bacteroidetes bacterium]|nr:NADH-quinone oxidoreductase subunit J [Bacteroidota bacterium]